MVHFEEIKGLIILAFFKGRFGKNSTLHIFNLY